LVGELQLRLAPVVLRSGVRMFEVVDPDMLRLEVTRVVEAPAATRLQDLVVRKSAVAGR
jgi:hypothetical protein